ncbi:MAG TPA: PIG-L family deacetylase [Fimbriimonadales bacterium]|nr:PIG-L family deacetylase [Fimbriimonadales bacterium]
MKPFELPPSAKRWLFAFTHPDDEISIAAWIKRLTDAGAEVWVGWSVTDEVRAAEGKLVMERLGVSGDHLFFHGMPDKCACDNLPKLTDLWAEAIQKARPERIAVGAFECGHIDHDSTNYAIYRASESVIPIFEIPFYHTYLTRRPIINRFADSDGQQILRLAKHEWKLKRRISKMYKSQNIGGLLVWYTLWGWANGRPPRLCRTERMRLQTHFDYFSPNLPELLRERVMQSKTWRRWVQAIGGR